MIFGLFGNRNQISQSLFTVFGAAMDFRWELEPVLGSLKSCKVRGPEHVIRLVIPCIIKAASVGLGTRKSF